jgi:hypothetical protein
MVLKHGESIYRVVPLRNGEFMALETISERTKPAIGHRSPRGTAEMLVSGLEKVKY